MGRPGADAHQECTLMLCVIADTMECLLGSALLLSRSDFVFGICLFANNVIYAHEPVEELAH